MDKLEIQRIARKTRGEMKRIIKRSNYFPSDCAGLCGIAAARLFQRLKKHGYVPKIAYSQNHCFVLCNGYIVDVTATQFNGEFETTPTVVVAIDYVKRLLREYGTEAHEDLYYWIPTKTFTSIRSFILWQKRTGWDTQQIARMQ